MPYVEVNNIDLYYERMGDSHRPAVLLVMGLGAQLVLWPDEFCEQLVEQGYQVIRFDNRDIGLSTKLDEHRAPDIGRLVLRRQLAHRLPVSIPLEVPYTLQDMVVDTVSLIDALSLDKVHLVGASMGGMISQMLAALYPERVLSLTSIMSSSGHPSLPIPSVRLMRQIIKRTKSSTQDAVIQRSMATWRMLIGPHYAVEEHVLEGWVHRNHTRGYHPRGYFRQLAAVVASSNHAHLLKRIKAPTLVLHGDKDPLLKLPHGVDVAKHIPNASMRIFPGMGHDLPAPLLPEFVSLIHEMASNTGHGSSPEFKGHPKVTPLSAGQQ